VPGASTFSPRSTMKPDTNLISCRPRAWNEVVGQDRVVSLLRSLLTTGRFMLRGYILKGPKGTGKTSVAYLFSRALMCPGGDPLGCGQCPSCRSIDTDGIEHDPDFYETDAASRPGVQDARSLMECMAQPPVAGRRRVALIDEAHRLSPEAWDVFLKPLEEAGTGSIFLFVTTDDSRIPPTVQSRCLPLPFSRVPDETVAGLLASIASQNGIDYELAALQDIARHSRGIPRDAIRWLAAAASLGKVTREAVGRVLDSPLEDTCLSCLLAVCRGDQAEAAKAADAAALMSPPSRAVETMFSLYARSHWAPPGTELARVASGLPSIRDTTGIFIRWLGTPLLPADALPLLVYELLGVARKPPRGPAGPKDMAKVQAILQGEVI
jgi:DNA polymerase III subunit gamma/tau